MIAPGCGLIAAAAQAERLREFISAQTVQVDGVAIPTTISIGVAAASDPSELSQILRAADEALYRAKKEGRNRVAVTSWDRATI